MTIPKSRKRAGSGEESLGVTLWRTIADEIERDIARGHYRSGERLPSEKDIASLFDVNRHTVRRAIAILANRGLLRAERGSGTFVEKGRIPYAIGRRTRFSENVSTAGCIADGRLISAATELADADVAGRLKLSRGALVVRINAIRKASRVPLCVGTSWLDGQRFADAGAIYADTGSMTATLAHFGVRDYTRATTRIAATRADAVDAVRLQLTPGAPILLIDSVDIDEHGRPIVATRARFAAERVELTIES
jgi:GntR family phosphonate transport system transcriptional regulator